MSNRLVQAAHVLLSAKRRDPAFIDELCRTGWKLRAFDRELSALVSAKALEQSAAADYQAGRAGAT